MTIKVLHKRRRDGKGGSITLDASNPEEFDALLSAITAKLGNGFLLSEQPVDISPLINNVDTIASETAAKSSMDMIDEITVKLGMTRDTIEVEQRALEDKAAPLFSDKPGEDSA